MKKILCFGDSNTFGYNPANGSRYDKDIRWSGILKSALEKNSDFLVLEKGCNNRTCIMDAGVDELTGAKILPKYLQGDISCVILAIGINDTQKFYNCDLSTLERGLEKLIEIIRSNNKETKILILSPAKLNKNILKSNFALMFDEVSIEKSSGISKLYQQIAKNNNCDFLDLDKIAKVSDIDGLHFDKAGHKAVAKEICKYFIKSE